MELSFRPRLTKGRHLQTVDETGPFCLVEAVGFNVDGKVDDSHPSIDPVLAAMARTLNDRMCTHYSHPLAEAAGMIAPSGDVCDACQALLWAVGERIALTSVDAEHLTEAELAAVHVRLALNAAKSVTRLIDQTDPLRQLVDGAILVATTCLEDPTPEHRAEARFAASRIEGASVRDNKPSTWAGHAAAHAVRAAAAIAGDKLDDVSTTHFFANRRSSEAITYALGAAAGDPVGSMRVARRVLNAFGKATSRNETPGVSEVVSRAELAKALDVPVEAITPVSVREGAANAARLERACEAAPSWEECMAEAERRAVESVPLNLAELDAAIADANAAADDLEETRPDEDTGDMDDFDESELGDVADEAIGELERAEAMLNAIANEHRTAESWWRKNDAGIPTEYRQKCCVSCRDAAGRPVPAPCRTMRIIEGYGE